MLRKIVRGLYYHHRGKPLGNSVSLEIYWDPNQPLTELALTLKPVIIDRDVFSYRHIMSEEDEDLSIWWLVFYRAFLAIGITGADEEKA